MAAGIELASRVAAAALATAREVLRGAEVAPDIVIVSRSGEIIAHAG